MKFYTVYFCTFFVMIYSASAQLTGYVGRAEIIGQKIVVKFVITNGLSESVVSARAVCFFMGQKGKVLGQTTKWVIGGSPGNPHLPSGSSTVFNFVISNLEVLQSTNVSATVIFDRVIISDGKALNPKKSTSVIRES